MANETNETKYDIELDEDTQKELTDNREADLKEVDKMYGAYDEATGTFTGGIGGQIDEVANLQIKNVNDYAEQQKQIQQDSYNQQKGEINQQKKQAGTDYIKEGAGAYADYQKAINPYGVNAERMAEQGHTGSGFAESSRVTMYTTYQNRVATARKVYSDAVVNFNNMLEQARIANNSAIAQIGFQAMQSQFEISMNALNKKGELVDKIANQKMAINARHDNLYQIELDKLYKDASLNEEARQFDTSQKLEEEKFGETKAQNAWDKILSLIQAGASNIPDALKNLSGMSGDTVNDLIGYRDAEKAKEDAVSDAQLMSSYMSQIANGRTLTTEELENLGISQDTYNSVRSSYTTKLATEKGQLESQNLNNLITRIQSGDSISAAELSALGLDEDWATNLANKYTTEEARESVAFTIQINDAIITQIANGVEPSDDLLAHSTLSADDVSKIKGMMKDSKKTEMIQKAFTYGYAPSDAELAEIGITTGSDEYTYITEYFDKLENSAILETGGEVTTDGYDWSSVSDSVGFKMDDKLKKELVKQGLFKQTEMGSGRKIVEVADQTALDFVNMAVANGKDAESAMKYYKDNLTELTVTWDGGINWWLGLDENAEVTDKNGKVNTLKELRKSLIPILGEDGAEKFARKLQNELGISEFK